MAYLGKKKIEKISYISFVDDIIEQYVGDSTFLKHNPETWQREEKDVYDMLNELEMKLKDKILEVLKG